MGRITSNVGLASGLPIKDIVDQLIEVSSAPRNILARRTEDLQSQQLAIGSLSAKLISIQFSLGKLTSGSLYAAKKATSSDATALTATIADSSSLVNSTYSFTPVRTATAQQLVSQRFDSKDSTFTAQNFSFRTGGFVDKGISLEELNGGLGVRLGQIRITDKSGESDVVDLRFASTVDDVLDAINSNATINVTAKAVGDSIQLVDNTGQAGTLSVQEVNNGKTALDLGLSTISASGATVEALGNDVFYLHSGTRLSKLNDGTGVHFTNDAAEVDDLVFEFADESGPIGLDLSGAKNLGDVVNAINDSTQLAGKVIASIAADGNRLELTDLTTGGGTFAVSNGVLGSAADDLGISQTAIGGTITGARLVSGLRDTLLSSLNGGSGIESPGNLEITNRSGVFSSIDLSTAETLGEVVDAINAQATDVTAEISDNRGGIVLTDTSGGSANNLLIASESGSTIAEDLGIVHDSTAEKVESGVLNRQLLSRATLLSSINGGRGISTLGDITITDTEGVKETIDLNPVDAEAKTIGDVIDRINASTLGVDARINDTGDGIVLVDTAGGSGKISVVDASGTVAADLNLLGESTEIDIEGVPTQVLNGTSTNSFAIEDDDTLADIVKKINDLDAGVTASLLNDGQGVRLSLTVEKTGTANALLLDFEEANFQFQEISKAQDALLQFGSVQESGGGILVTSSTNSFKEVVSGLNLTIQKASTTPVSITVASNESGLVTAAEDFIASYNSLRDELGKLTDFDPTAQTTGLLFGTGEALRVDTQLSRLVTDRHFGLGSFETLAEIGIKINGDGKLELDKAKFQEAYQTDPEGLQAFFGDDEKGGVASKFDSIVEQLAGETGGMLTNRNDSLQSTIDSNSDRIAQLDAFLERQRETLLLQYAQLESILSNFQATQSALSAFSPVPPLGSVA